MSKKNKNRETIPAEAPETIDGDDSSPTPNNAGDCAPTETAEEPFDLGDAKERFLFLTAEIAEKEAKLAAVKREIAEHVATKKGAKVKIGDHAYFPSRVKGGAELTLRREGGSDAPIL